MPLEHRRYTDGTPVPELVQRQGRPGRRDGREPIRTATTPASSTFNYVNGLIGYRIDLIGDIRHVPEAAAAAVSPAAHVFDAILFDNDGVLVDTEHLYFRANQETLARVGIDLDAATYVELFLREGRGAWHLARDARPRPGRRRCAARRAGSALLRAGRRPPTS